MRGLEGDKLYELVGQRFGKLVVLEPIDRRDENGLVKKNKKGRAVPQKYLCKCDCGELSEVAKSSLTSGRSRSCGCGMTGRPSYGKENTTRAGRKPSWGCTQVGHCPYSQRHCCWDCPDYEGCKHICAKSPSKCGCYRG